jgi:hypothetical protein
VKGTIAAIDAEAKKFTVGKGKKKVVVSTKEGTEYLKGETGSTFETVVVKNATVEVEMANGSAVKVTGK